VVSGLRSMTTEDSFDVWTSPNVAPKRLRYVGNSLVIPPLVDASRKRVLRLRDGFFR
jgi:hypothetical protein